MPKKTKPPRPLFVKLGGHSALRRTGKKYYYRDAGEWGVTSQWVDGVLRVSKKESGTRAGHLVGEEMVEITQEEWEGDNRGYVDHLKGKDLTPKPAPNYDASDSVEDIAF